MHPAIQVLNDLVACALAFPILSEAAIAVNGTGGDGGEEQQEHEVLERVDLLDQIILNAQQHVNTAKSDVGKPEENKRRLSVEKRQYFFCNQRQDAQCECDIKCRLIHAAHADLQKSDR